jgi:2-polyprenyl-3-methyl-5-hydroxy-6-metoxy-1,4-benzoquinol methylase
MKVKTLLKKILKKMINPKSIVILMRIRRDKKKKKGTTYVDSWLKLYAQITPGQFLHYPYFTDPEIKNEDISTSDIRNAGNNYTNLIIDKIQDKKSPVLDVGCGLGELCNMLQTRGYKPVALNPDQYQCSFIQKHYPDIELIKSKFEDMDHNQYRHHFGTIITAESLQYLKLEKALPQIDYTLKPDGHWIIGDYFKIKAKSSLRGGKNWEQFVDKINESGWEIRSEQDITRNVLPFIDYCNMLANRLILPLVDHSIDSLKRKKPGIFYMLEEAIDLVRADLLNLMDYIDPEVFAQERKYMLLVLKKG